MAKKKVHEIEVEAEVEIKQKPKKKTFIVSPSAIRVLGKSKAIYLCNELIDVAYRSTVGDRDMAREIGENILQHLIDTGVLK